jgi:hypothetical protein
MNSNQPPNKSNGARSAPATSDPVAAQIEAEIADHLATAAGELQAAGVTPQEAQHKAETRFGDAATIGRRCYWIKQGDTIMFRYATIGLLVILCLALAATTIGSWRSQARMAEQMDALTLQLRALADAQQAAAEQAAAQRAAAAPAAEPQPLEITGKAFVGSPDKPAQHIQLTVIDVKDGSTVRKIATDSDGSFRSGPLAGGDYALVSTTNKKLPNDSERRANRNVQSAPIGVYPGVPVPEPQFDVDLHVGGVVFETSRPLPQVTIDDRYMIDTRLMVKSLSQNPCRAEGDPRGHKHQDSFVVEELFLPPDHGPPKPMEPRLSALIDPPPPFAAALMVSPLARLPTHRDVNPVMVTRQPAAKVLRMVRLVGVHMLRPMRLRLGTMHRDTLQRGHGQLQVVTVGRSHSQPKHHAAGVGQHRPFHARLPTIRRIWPGFFPRPVELSSGSYPATTTATRCRGAGHAPAIPPSTSGGTRPAWSTVESSGADCSPNRIPATPPSTGKRFATQSRCHPRRHADPTADDRREDAAAASATASAAAATVPPASDDRNSL